MFISKCLSGDYRCKRRVDSPKKPNDNFIKAIFSYVIVRTKDESS